MRKILGLRWLTGFVVAGALGACVHTTPYGVTYVGVAPPVLRTEVVTTSPGTGFVWVGGHWGWRDNSYQWISGSWVRPAVGYSTWIPGHWDHDRHGWFWTDGHWR